MFNAMRKTFGPVAVGIIIGAIALVFVFFGIYNPRTKGGMRSASTAAEVNGELIRFPEFEREYQMRMEYYEEMFKGKMDANMLQQLGLRQQVLEEMITRKLISQEANRLGLRVPDDEVREKIYELPYFKDKTTGQFDPMLYKNLLQANHRSAADFEESIREDLLRRDFMDFVKKLTHVSDTEVQLEFQATENTRRVQYILVDAKAIEQALPKDLSKDKRAIEEDKLLRALSDDALASAKGKTGLKAFLKSKKLELKTSEKFNSMQSPIPTVGELSDLAADAFKAPSPLSKEPKRYAARGGYVIVTQVEEFKPNPAELDKKRDALIKAVQAKKEQELFSQWVRRMQENAKILRNPLLASRGTPPAGAPSDDAD